MLGLVLAAFALPAAADGNGLAVPADAPAWSRWQGRIALNTTTPLWRSDLARGDAAGLKVQGLGLVGDYYFARWSLGDAGGGFRATSGVLLGSGAPLWAASQAGTPGTAFGRRNVSLLNNIAGADAATADAGNTVPYVGLGYSGLSSRGGFSFAADVGVMALNAGSAVRLGRLFNGNQSLDDLLRDIRLTPVLQLGVSYSF